MNIHFRGETTEDATFVVRRETVLTVNNTEGAESTAGFVGSVFQRGDEFTLVSYLVDEWAGAQG